LIEKMRYRVDAELKREAPVLLTYLIPFTFNPIYFVNALLKLDSKLVPKLSQELSNKLKRCLDDGNDPLAALLKVSSEIQDNIISRLIQNYVYVAKHVGSATILSISFLEEALAHIKTQWRRYINYMNLVTEITVVLFMSSILGVILSLFNYQNLGYLAMIPLSLVFTVIGSTVGYIYIHPWMGNFYQEFQVNRKLTILLYIVVIVILIGIFKSIPILYLALSSILIGIIVEYESFKLEKKFNMFIDDISSIMNNLEVGFPETPEITSLVAKHGLSGRIGTLLTGLSKGVTIAGETGLRASFNKIVNIIQASYRSFRKYRSTLNMYVLIIIATLLVTIYTVHTIAGIAVGSFRNEQLYLQKSVVNEVNTLALATSYVVPVVVGLSYRPKLSPILYSGISLFVAYSIAVLF
jgi:hypothetical protein